MTKWMKKLNKADLDHLKESGARSLKEIKINLDFQNKNLMVCRGCKSIAHKLKIIT